jgi:class 3 adenylate cyclase/tetratricopeptide (TPR) repeat protein
VLSEVQALLRRERRVSYRGLKRRFALDDEYIEDLKEELIGARQIAEDVEGRFLIWAGGRASPPISSPSPSNTSPAPAIQSGLPDAERRQLTVMFCDLVDSTALSAQLDPEDLRDVVHAYQTTCTEVIQRFGGHIAQHLGDGLLVYFGYPAAHEDDAQRAVRAGLEIAATVGARCNVALPSGPRPLKVRIGIHTGLVVIGEIGGNDKRETLALGETPNLAARLQGVAEPDTVVVSAATQRLVLGLFEHQDLGPQSLKGFAAPPTAYRILGETPAQSRFEAALATGLSSFVGRDEELRLLQVHWQQAKDCHGQVISVQGEPGIGKSHLIQAFKEEVRGEPSTWIEFRCSSNYQNTAFYPVISHLQRIMQTHRLESAQSKLAKLESLLIEYRFPRRDTLGLFAALLSLPFPASATQPVLPPQKQKQRTIDALVAWLLEEAERQPVCCVWEDLQWADPSALAMIEACLIKVPTARLLVVLSSRSDFTPPCVPRTSMTTIVLNRLTPIQVNQMVETLTVGRTLPHEVVQQIIAKTDGVPLFIEEVTKMMMESEFCRRVEGRYELTGPLPAFAIPSTLHDSLMARLDRLSPVREIAQLGAALGREFSYELIAAVAPCTEKTLLAALEQLVDAELMHQRGTPPQAQYAFKHALVRDTAYQSLLKSKRQQVHQTVARALDAMFPEIRDAQPEILAYHFTEGGLKYPAIDFWLKAGQRASERSAYVEAASHLFNGLTLVRTLPDTAERLSHELALQSALGPVLIATKGWAASQTRETYIRAQDLAEQLGRTTQLFRAMRGIVSAQILEGKLNEARELGTQLLIVAERDKDPAMLLEAYNTLGIASLYLGDSISARAQLERGAAIDSMQHDNSPRASSLQSAQDPRVAGLAHLALPLWFLGYPDLALQRSLQALSLSKEISHPFSMVYALFGHSLVRHFRRETSDACAFAEEAIDVSHEHGFALWEGYAVGVRGWTLVEQGHVPEGIAQLWRAITAIRAAGTDLVVPHFLGLLADAYRLSDEIPKGMDAVAEALRIVEKSAERIWSLNSIG